MSSKCLRVAAAVAVLGASAGSAAAQGQGYGVGEWNLVTQGGASVCNVVLTRRQIPQQASYAAHVRPGGRCTDWRVRAVALWSVRGNTLKLGDASGHEIAGLAEQNPNLYASGEWQLHRVGSHYQPGPGPGPGPGYPPSGGRPGQGYGIGEWNLINQANGSVCHIVLTNRLTHDRSAYHVVVRGGPRCRDWIGQNVAIWVVRGNTLKLGDAGGRELAGLTEQGPNQYAAGGFILRRRGAYY